VGKQFKDFAEFMAQRNPARPFFFWSGNTDTALHQWRYEPEAWAGLDPRNVKVPPELPDAPVIRTNLLAYYGAVGRMDAATGRVLGELETRNLLDETLVVYTSDNGWQMPRGLANCYDTGTRVPLAIRWGNRLQAGRRAAEFISLTDFAPTVLEAAGIKAPPEMTGRSFLDVVLGKPAAAQRDHVFIERERHANVRQGDLSYPIRGIRTRDFLLLLNLRPERWPAGDPVGHVAVGDYGDVDGSWAKAFILERAEQPEMKRFYQLHFAKRPVEELYDLRKDPAQLENVAGRPEYAAAQRELRGRVERWMRETADPRVNPDYDAWDKYPYFGGNFRDRGKARKKQP
jgi:arylsulfatase A-like enzyme